MNGKQKDGWMNGKELHNCREKYESGYSFRLYNDGGILFYVGS